ncbi:MAG: hypothetical protein N4A61_00435 [Pelagimonas sp.]|jgi:hypothetical protein|nr:hypothetical protein [Pelagimonas sp.]
MSDPVTNVEIEDVLSSIRRLVSDDSRREPRQTARPRADRFVLTPALRVEADNHDDLNIDASEDAPKETQTLADPAPDAGAQPIDPVEFDSIVYDDLDGEASENTKIQDHEIDMLSKLVEQELARSLDPEMDTDDGPSREPEDRSHSSALDSATPELLVLGEAEVAHSEALQDGEADVETAPKPEIDQSLAQKISELENLISRMAEAPQSQDADQTLEPTATDQNAGLDTDETPESDAAVFHRSASAVEFTPAAPAPAHEEETSPEMEMGAEAQVEPVETPVSRGEDDHQVDATEDAVTFDETMLRDLVARLVKEELHGALGERITRNVRKLVRREVHRQLTARDQD